MKIILNTSWIAGITGALLVIAWFTFPNEENRLNFIEKRMDDIQEQRKVLTEQEKQLEKLATEKEWEEVDNDNNK